MKMIRSSLNWIYDGGCWPSVTIFQISESLIYSQNLINSKSLGLEVLFRVITLKNDYYHIFFYQTKVLRIRKILL